MANVVIIGAGSGFGKRLSLDILAHEALRTGSIALVDINEESARHVAEWVQALVRQLGAPVEVRWATDRREVLPGADYVVVAIAVGGRAYAGSPYYDEVMIPAEYGVEQSVADTVGVGGVFRTLRTAPEMLRICRDMEELCPDALLINYTNPMAMLCWAMNEATGIEVVGLCHSVQGTSEQLARYINKPFGEMRFWVAGINHMAWFLQLEWNDADAYPLLFEAAENPEIRAKDPVRFEILRQFGCFVTESSTHMSEYVPYFRKRRELWEPFGLKERRPAREVTGSRWDWQDPDFLAQVRGEKPIEVKASHEYASGIMNGIESGAPFRFNGNVANDGIITNLPPECVVEVPCFADREGVHPCVIGELPTQLAALNLSNIVVQDLTVQAALEGDREKAIHACMLDPLTAAVCSLAEIRTMCDRLFEAEKHLLGYLE
ncbi:MAG TPA: alpha-galactosidase [Planctomycetota bacterium]|nr:alpha-galactosidase [Planctomycetota bacterium]HRR79757.1 alpha-galactosidase [Planctomycetota bacterium]HRT96298.1 alpha-galactosidase [Planctomycetota bacterium]